MAAIKGLDGLMKRVEQLKKLPKEFAKEALRRVKDYTPVLTGNLEESWEIQVKGTTIDLVNTATNEEGEYYGPYVEWGTASQPGQFMATRTMAEASQILDVAKKKVGL